MWAEEVASFPEEAANELETYVYRLIDPRNGETFYVGRGKGNRAEEVARFYVGKAIPEAYRKRGAANPVRYTW
ncbi:hypothetical protein LIP_1553 [Limnochorda pilosa]|uniref:GIY-YIG domain-containing protein n=1 Tax=Limnochorda pilosa TaxID=1555112 RepID=A0A0K2SJX7_LIMPI|nr:hypothetical protein LIP_1553 [Limnochorda pilosa]